MGWEAISRLRLTREQMELRRLSAGRDLRQAVAGADVLTEGNANRLIHEETELREEPPETWRE